MIYILLFFLLILGVILGSKYPKYEKNIFILILVILAVMGSIRYGSGADYFAYKHHYYILPPNIIDAVFHVSSTDSAHLDVGFRIIVSVCKSLGMNYEFFIALLSTVTTGLIGYTIYKNSKLKILSWVIFLGNYYLVYMNSALRQGLAMTLFIFAFYQFYKNKKYFLFVLFLLIGGTIHSSCIIGFVVFVIDVVFKYNLNTKKNNIFIFVFAFLFITLNIPKLIIMLFNLEFFYSFGNINWMPLSIRLCYLIFVYIFMKLNVENENNIFKQKQIYLFFISVVIYVGLSRFSIASRVTDYFMFLEIILLPNLISNSDLKIKKIFSLFTTRMNLSFHKKIWTFMYVLLISILFVKDLIACTYQERYYDHSPLNYTYITIFNKEELYSLREMESNFPR